MKFKSITFFWFILSMVVFSGFVFADDHGDLCDSTATYMSLNTSQPGNIETAGDHDLFRIYVPSSGLLTVYTTGITDTYGGLGKPDCYAIEWDDDDGDGYNFKISLFVIAGTYYVGVTHYSSSGTGPYTLHVQFGGTTDDHGNTCNTATPITLSGGIGSQSGSLTAGDYDYFSVDVPSSGTLTAYTTESTDTYGYLKNSGCQDIDGAEDDDDGDGYNFKISQFVTAGTYYVAVRHYGSSRTGAYTLNVTLVTSQLTVPYLKQQDIPTIGRAACASASSAMVLAYHRKIGNSQQDMIAAATTVFNATSSLEQGLLGRPALATHLQQLYGFFSVIFHERGGDSNWGDLYETIKTEIKNGRPMILGSHAMTQAGHYIVVIGYEGDDYTTGKLIVNDPFGRWNGSRDSYSTSVSGAGLTGSFTAITSSRSDDGVFVLIP